MVAPIRPHAAESLSHGEDRTHQRIPPVQRGRTFVRSGSRRDGRGTRSAVRERAGSVGPGGAGLWLVSPAGLRIRSGVRQDDGEPPQDKRVSIRVAGGRNNRRRGHLVDESTPPGVARSSPRLAYQLPPLVVTRPGRVSQSPPPPEECVGVPPVATGACVGLGFGLSSGSGVPQSPWPVRFGTGPGERLGGAPVAAAAGVQFVRLGRGRGVSAPPPPPYGQVAFLVVTTPPGTCGRRGRAWSGRPNSS